MTIDYNTTPLPWLKVGAAVAVVTRGRMGDSMAVETTVVKLTKRDIVLADGQRFRHNDQTNPSIDTGHGLGCYSLWEGKGFYQRRRVLRSVLDPNVQRISVEVRRANAGREVEKAYANWNVNRSPAAADVLRRALTAWEAEL